MVKLCKFSNVSKFLDVVETFTFRIITINQRYGYFINFPKPSIPVAFLQVCKFTQNLR